MTALTVLRTRVLLRGGATLAAAVAFGLVAVLGLSSFRQVGLGSVGPAAAALVNLALLMSIPCLAAAAAAAAGVLVGALASTRLQVAVAGIAVWFTLVIGFDLVIIGLGVFLHLGEPTVAGAIMADPLSAARTASLPVLDAAGGALGPTGAYLIDRFGRDGAVAVFVAVVAGWTAVPLVAATAIAARRDG